VEGAADASGAAAGAAATAGGGEPVLAEAGVEIAGGDFMPASAIWMAAWPTPCRK
jgi:hypothetical protein